MARKPNFLLLFLLLGADNKLCREVLSAPSPCTISPVATVFFQGTEEKSRGRDKEGKPEMVFGS